MSEPAGPAPRSRIAWLLERPPNSERALHMEALIARLRLLVVFVNSITLAFLLDTDGMHMRAAWALITFAWIYSLPIALVQPYRRWQVFRANIASAALDSIAIVAFIFVTGASKSPYFVLTYLSVAAVAMRFSLRQAMATCGLYAVTYAAAYLTNWQPSQDEAGVLFLRIAYLAMIAIGVGYLAREEETRALEVEQIERLNAENSRLLSRNERAARVDRLTGLLNRAAFEKEFRRELKRARASRGYLTLLFCDMDRLKRVNDEMGHDYGDRVLRQIALAMKRALRSGEFIGRFGGDEFVVGLPSQTREMAYDRGDQLIEAVRSVSETLPQQLAVGLSVGVATYPSDSTDPGLLVKLADQAMYLAKRDGGDRVRTASDLRMFWEELPTAA